MKNLVVASRSEIKSRSANPKLIAQFCITLKILFPILAAATLSVVSGVSQERASTAMNQLDNMISAINKIRESRDIDLDCSEYVYRFLGKQPQLKYYIELFGENGVSPEIVGRYVGFRIEHSRLKRIPRPLFGVHDYVVVEFVIDGDDSSASVRSCKAVLRAAPGHL